MNEPPLRRSTRPFPPYRFVPGQSPHPRRDPKGWAYGQPDPKPSPLLPEEWRKNEAYLFGVDLFNYGYWWECHEQFEALWHLTGHEGVEAEFLQGLIQIAAAHLKRQAGQEGGVRRLAEEGLRRLSGVPAEYMGIDVARFIGDARGYLLDQDSEGPAFIWLAQ